MRGLNLDDFQWLELLEARTDGDALELIKENRILMIENSPEEALQEVRTQMNSRFHTEERPAKQLIRDLQYGPTVSVSKPNKLFNFAQKCHNASKLYDSHPEKLKELESQSTQNLIIKRLDPDLSVKWFEYKEVNLSKYTTIPFELFARWIGSRARIYLERQEILDNEPSTSQSHSNLQKTTTSSQNERTNYQSSGSFNQQRRPSPQGNR